MDTVGFNYTSNRAKQARLGKVLGSKTTYGGLLFGVGGLVAGGLLVVVGLSSSIGWLIASFAGPLWALAVWGQSLNHLKPSSDTTTVDDVLDSPLLAHLPREHSPKDLATLVKDTPGSNFMANRFLLSIDFIADMASTNSQDSQAVWVTARRYQATYGFETINAAVLVAALVQTVQGIDDYVAHLGLDKDDIGEGLWWYKHIEDLVTAHKARRPKGGIGRDWAFGYHPLLDHIGFNISEHITFSGSLAHELDSRTQIVSAVTHTLAQAGRRNVALVGQLGSGKTKLVYNLAEQLLEADPNVPKSLHYHQVVALDPSGTRQGRIGRAGTEDLL
jgi:hypothetical protein